MGYLTLFFIALGLAMDAFAVSMSNGICYKNAGFKEAFITALTFGTFQALMPLAGYFAGRTVSDAIAFLDHWIALGMLSFIGISMIAGAIREMRNPDIVQCKAYCSVKDLMVQGVATSIDALAVGVSFAVIDTNIFAAVGLIGIVTFVCCVIGVLLGKGFGFLIKEKAEIFGGCILIIIGLKIFIEHTSAM
ncbi:MAG TPA: manganese efflux pump MntP family protein [Bacillota bacterium]|jgi:putative Mn2+ efflux pump MntP|nr:manganese efflux pump MntP family protein [Bacillota bacterium]